ncbi:hypothetical protein GLOIN_2v1510726 [Rhizophagus irregularis DAOM 181602=DAOM 197198]|uniref:Uncharacterized protein n=1 Tax=Rhizophagus irregularis (strain DAOM 181602 / DAOM 197198 / MUCL 43194) TaxID=747089 RepID=U9T646_RHIID|nr:hypothetical protein GLOIN_2v1510726 [Rhizophagus irregularis DAOM 181602=DAOM 197198]
MEFIDLFTFSGKEKRQVQYKRVDQKFQNKKQEHEKERVARGITDVLLQEIKLNVFCRVSENSFVEIIARLIDTAMYRFPVDYEIEVTRAE